MYIYIWTCIYIYISIYTILFVFIYIYIYVFYVSTMDTYTTCTIMYKSRLIFTRYICIHDIYIYIYLFTQYIFAYKHTIDRLICIWDPFKNPQEEQVTKVAEVVVNNRT